jgi:hypothetical protein
VSQRQFNIVRGCFWLIAFVIGAHVIAALAAEAACLWHAQAIIDGKAECDANGRLTEILAAALAAALAFAGGHMNRPQPDDKEPDA